MRNKSVLFLTQAAVIAAIYVVLVQIFAPISFREVQVRIAAEPFRWTLRSAALRR